MLLCAPDLFSLEIVVIKRVNHSGFSTDAPGCVPSIFCRYRSGIRSSDLIAMTASFYLWLEITIKFVISIALQISIYIYYLWRSSRITAVQDVNYPKNSLNMKVFKGPFSTLKFEVWACLRLRSRLRARCSTPATAKNSALLRTISTQIPMSAAKQYSVPFLKLLRHLRPVLRQRL